MIYNSPQAGEMLKGNNDIKPGGDRKSSLHDARMKLSDFGITEIQSHRWQLEAEIPEDQTACRGISGVALAGNLLIPARVSTVKVEYRPGPG